MTNYRKKPVVIQATQWFKDGDHPAVIRKSGPNRIADEGIPWVPTLEGGHVVTPGDWIITGVKGECYPCNPDIFAATYEPAAAPAAPVLEDENNLIDAADKHAQNYAGDPRDCIKTDVLNAFYAGAKWQARASLRTAAPVPTAAPQEAIDDAIRAARNSAFERAAEMCEQRAVSGASSASGEATARQCARDIRSQKHDLSTLPAPDTWKARNEGYALGLEDGLKRQLGSSGNAGVPVEHEHGCAIHYYANAKCTCGVQGGGNGN